MMRRVGGTPDHGKKAKSVERNDDSACVHRNHDGADKGAGGYYWTRNRQARSQEQPADRWIMRAISSSW